MVRCLMVLVLAAVCLPGAAAAFFDPITEACQPPVMSGIAEAIDGNTLTLVTSGGGRIVIRLHAIDAPDMIQTCRIGEDIWDCGREAKAALAGLVDGRELACLACGIDERGRTLATCLDGESDIGTAMVRSGMAVGRAFFSNALNASEARAKLDGIGLWRGDFVDPDAWRRGQRLGEGPCRGCTLP